MTFRVGSSAVKSPFLASSQDFSFCPIFSLFCFVRAIPQFMGSICSSDVFLMISLLPLPSPYSFCGSPPPSVAHFFFVTGVFLNPPSCFPPSPPRLALFDVPLNLVSFFFFFRCAHSPCRPPWVSPLGQMFHLTPFHDRLVTSVGRPALSLLCPRPQPKRTPPPPPPLPARTHPTENAMSTCNPRSLLVFFAKP